MSSSWTFDRSNGTATHESGLVLSMKGGEVIDILSFPKGMATKEFPHLIDEAQEVYSKSAKQPPTYAKPSPTGPRGKTLSLKKRS